MITSSPGNGQYGGVLAGVKAKPSGWPTASLDTDSGHHPPAAARGSSKQLHHNIPTTEVPTESGEARTPRSHRDDAAPAMPQHPRLRPQQQPTLPLIQMRQQHSELRRQILHRHYEIPHTTDLSKYADVTS